MPLTSDVHRVTQNSAGNEVEGERRQHPHVHMHSEKEVGGDGLAVMFEGKGGPMTKTCSTAKVQFSSLASINMKPDNCTSGKKNAKGKKSISVILSKGNKTSWHTVLFVETAPGYMPQSISHVEGGLRKTYVVFYSLM